MMNTKGTSQSQQTRTFGTSARILQINAEGLSRDKCEYLSKLATDLKIDILAVQETHLTEDLERRGNIAGYRMIARLFSSIHGSAVYARNNLCNLSEVNCHKINDIEIITVKLNNLTIMSIYKPPSSNWPTPPLPPLTAPCIYIGDFNSHHTTWGYSNNDENGEKLATWCDSQDLYLSWDAKETKTFHSARWQSDTNPDLVFVSTDERKLPLDHTRKVLQKFPRSQHRPTLITIGLEIPIIRSVHKPRWNFKKANWDNYSSEVDCNLRWIPPKAENYKRFVGVVIGAAKRNVPRGFRKQYIPCWDKSTETLYVKYQKNGDPEMGKQILEELNESRKEKWKDLTSQMSFTHSSRKAWSLLRKLGAASNICKEEPGITPAEMALHIKSRADKIPMDLAMKNQTERELNNTNSNLQTDPSLSNSFSDREIESAINMLKLRKASGLDGIYPEFIRYLGKLARTWLKNFFSDILDTGIIPPEFKMAHTLAILKPGKPADTPSNYRPIALLSVCYKLLERLILNRIQGIINNITPPYQAGFRTQRSCCEQVLALTSFIEAGFQKKLKTSVAFVDLTAAYDTVWLNGLLLKLKRLIPCPKLTALLKNMLTSRYFKVTIGQRTSRSFSVKNGLPQGSVLAPLLFNLYTSDMPDTISNKFCYADDLALAVQTNTLEEGESILSSDLQLMHAYYTKWRLSPNPNKTEVCAFHLCNRIAHQQLKVNFCQHRVKHNFNPKYLGITLDRSLTFKKHLENTGQKLKSRNNIMKKLAGTSWGADATSLRTTALSMVYPVAEYCAPVWHRSAHTKKIDVHLNESMRIITGTLRSTPTPWLHTISNITPPELRRQDATVREWRKLHQQNYPQDLPIHDVLNDLPSTRLRSRKPIWHNMPDNNIMEQWRQNWKSAPVKHQGILDPTIRLPGFNLKRNQWVKLNRLRTGHARCNAMLFKWGLHDSPACDCGAPLQTAEHIVQECPLRKYAGSAQDVISATPPFLDWLQQLDTAL